MAICPKLQNGSMEYEIDYEEKHLRLVKDMPATGDKGASFSDEWIDFDKINEILRENNFNKQSIKFAKCFTKSSANNAPMLAAALKDLSILDSNYNVLKYL